MHEKLASDSFLILLNNPKQPSNTRYSFKNRVFLKEDSFQPVPFNRQGYQIEKGSGTSHQSTLRPQKKFRKIHIFVIFLSDQVWWCNGKQFLSYSKNFIFKLMQVNSWHHKLFHFHLSFWIWKVWKRRENITKRLKWKEVFRWNKKHFS